MSPERRRRPARKPSADGVCREVTDERILDASHLSFKTELRCLIGGV